MGQACSTWALQAVATVIQRRVVSLYPPGNGSAGIPEKLLNCTFEPVNRRRNMYQPVSVMWTRNAPSHQRATTWTPNHFAPILPALTVPESTVDVNAEVQRTEVGMDRANDENRCAESHEPESVDHNDQPVDDLQDCAEPYDDGREHDDDDDDGEDGELVTDSPRLVRGHKRGVVLSIGGFLFAKDKNKKDKTYWRCTDRGNCSARMTTMQINDITDNVIIVSPVPSHAHPPVPAVVCRRTAITAMCSTVDGNPLASVRGAFDAVVCSSSAEHITDTPTYNSVRRILNRQRALHVPRLPYSVTVYMHYVL